MNGHTTTLSTPNIAASDAVVVLHSKADIAAPATVVFRALRNTDTWRDWNRFVPKVNITYQPPEDDHVTAAEIQELVRNTSIAGSFFSDLTDGSFGPKRPRSPDEQPPPRYRLNSISSQMSQMSQDSQENKPRRASEGADGTGLDSVAKALRAASPSSMGDGTHSPKSAAREFQEALESRRASVGSDHHLAPISQKLIENTGTHRASVAVPASPGGRRKSTTGKSTLVASQKAAERAHQALITVYGEPSVRLQNGTKLTFYVRMKPTSPSEFTEVKMVVTEVARPDDPVTEQGTTALTRSKTHNLDRSGKYRIVWATDTEKASIFNFSEVLKGTKMPKYLLQGERVHEIEPTGDETCTYRTWELQKGHAAKAVKKKHGEFLQKMFEVWAAGLKDFCEGLHAPKIDRRDFSISADEVPMIIQSLT